MGLVDLKFCFFFVGGTVSVFIHAQSLFHPQHNTTQHTHSLCAGRDQHWRPAGRLAEVKQMKQEEPTEEIRRVDQVTRHGIASYSPFSQSVPRA